jgi:hypothetical protein
MEVGPTAFEWAHASWDNDAADLPRSDRCGRRGRDRDCGLEAHCLQKDEEQGKSIRSTTRCKLPSGVAFRALLAGNWMELGAAKQLRSGGVGELHGRPRQTRAALGQMGLTSVRWALPIFLKRT